MRKVAALYDIHGNLPALRAVLREVGLEDVDGIVVGGDVLPGPMPSQTLAALLDLAIPVEFIYGNGDRDVLATLAGEESVRYPAAFREVMQWNGEQLTAEQRAHVATWPATLRLDVTGLGEVLFCHGTPRDDAEIFTRLTSANLLLPIFRRASVSTVICGHTHMQFDRLVGSTRVVNAGSVGMPFGEPGAYWALLGPSVELRRTEYDLEQAAAEIRATAYPDSHTFITRNLLEPPAEEEMLELFERSVRLGADPGAA